jgi:DNA adenine methylase
MTSPLRYPGGKTRACKTIDDIMTTYYDLPDTLCSPFLGGGSFELYVKKKYNMKLIVNDKFTPLFHFWSQVKTNSQQLCDDLTQIPVVSKALFTHYRETIMDLTDPRQQAVQYFIINRCSFSGATLSGGFSPEASAKRYTASSIEKIRQLDLSEVDLYNYDFEYFIGHCVPRSAFLFLDPPYYLEKKSKLYGKDGNMHEDFRHDALFELLRTKENWLLHYNDCDYIRTLYKDYFILDAQWSYGMNKSKRSSEIIILSIRVD